jgi:hypothetical protein
VSEKKQILKNITPSQKLVITEIAVNILKGNIPLDKNIFTSLKKVKFYIRKLSKKVISRKALAKASFIVCKLIEIALCYHEACEPISFSSNRRMGIIKKNKCAKDKKSKTSKSTSRKAKHNDSISSIYSTSKEFESDREGEREKQFIIPFESNNEQSETETDTDGENYN